MRTVGMPLDKLLDLVTAIQFDGIDQVHWFLGEAVGQLQDQELREYVATLERDGYDRHERSEADHHLRQWRSRYCGAKPKPQGPGPAQAQPESVQTFDGYGEGYET